MNIGLVFVDIIQALLSFGGSITTFLGSKIDISIFLNTMRLLGLDMTSIPNEISALAIIGSLGGFAILLFFVIKLIRG